jgi:antirestriction protein ArdC
MALIRRFGKPDVMAAPAPDASAAVVDTVSSDAPSQEAAPRSRWRSGQGEKGASIDNWQNMTDLIVARLEVGVSPWRRDWDGRVFWPRNGLSERPYHGVNVPMLLAKGYQDPRWATFKMAKDNGWHIRKGERNTPIYRHGSIEVESGRFTEAGDPIMKKILFLKRHAMFNYSQIEGTPAWTSEPAKSTLSDELADRVENIVSSMGANVVHGFRVPMFVMDKSSTDEIRMPEVGSFETQSGYYAALLHELAHWTGHPDRGNRIFALDRESPDYAREELRAEIASAMLCARLGIPYALEGHASYIAGFVRVLKEDKKEIYRASKDAESIATMILAFDPTCRDEIRAEAQAMQADAEAANLNEFFDGGDFDYDEDLIIDAEFATAGYRP